MDSAFESEYGNLDNNHFCDYYTSENSERRRRNDLVYALESDYGGLYNNHFCDYCVGDYKNPNGGEKMKEKELSKIEENLRKEVPVFHINKDVIWGGKTIAKVGDIFCEDFLFRNGKEIEGGAIQPSYYRHIKNIFVRSSGLRFHEVEEILEALKKEGLI